MEQIRSKEMEQLHFSSEETESDAEEMLILAEQCFSSPSPEEWRIGAIWLKKAALSGHTEAMYQWGMRLWDGNQVEQNKESAIGWILRAAHRGHAEAMYRVNQCFYYGELLTLDREEADRWLKRAAEAGHLLARRELENGRQQHHPLPEESQEEKSSKTSIVFMVAIILLLIILAVYFQL
jgi:TPR repeat protein